MANVLDDNTVIPSYLGSQERGGSPGSTALLNDNVMRLGEVKKIVYPDDDLSYGKKAVEYEVEVQYRDGNGIYTTSTWRGVTVSTLFGGRADRYHATMRADAEKDNSTSGDSSSDNSVGIGNKVLLLCLAGDQQKAIIMGAVNDPDDENIKGESAKDKGHNLFFEFNGVRFTIEDNGRTVLTFKGATDEKGHVKEDNKDSTGATLEITDKGDMKMFVYDKNGDDQARILWDHQNGNMELYTSGDLKTKSDKETDMDASKGFSLLVGQGKAEFRVRDEVIIDCDAVQVNKADEAWVLGTTWRKDLKSMHDDIKSALNSASQALSQASTQMGVGSTLNAIPYTGGGAAQSNFKQVGMKLSEAGQQLSKAASAISTYEGKADGHLSEVHFGSKK